MTLRLFRFQQTRDIFRDYLRRSMANHKGGQLSPRAHKLVIFCIASKDLKNPVRVAAENLGDAIRASGHDPDTCHCEMLGTIFASDTRPQFVLLTTDDLRDQITRLVER